MCPLSIGGVEDHVHILARLGRTMSQGAWIKELKRASNLWVKQQPPPLPSTEKDSTAPLGEFAWQAGYACFSVSVSKLDVVTTYIDRQEKHHLKRSFQDELRVLLKKHDVPRDERHVWD